MQCPINPATSIINQSQKGSDLCPNTDGLNSVSPRITRSWRRSVCTGSEMDLVTRLNLLFYFLPLQEKEQSSWFSCWRKRDDPLPGLGNKGKKEKRKKKKGKIFTAHMTDKISNQRVVSKINFFFSAEGGCEMRHRLRSRILPNQTDRVKK